MALQVKDSRSLPSSGFLNLILQAFGQPIATSPVTENNTDKNTYAFI